MGKSIAFITMILIERPRRSAHALRQLYPKHSLVMTQDYRINILSFPGIFSTPLEKDPLFTELVFLPLSRALNPIPGVLVDEMTYGGFNVKCNVSRVALIELPKLKSDNSNMSSYYMLFKCVR